MSRRRSFHPASSTKPSAFRPFQDATPTTNPPSVTLTEDLEAGKNTSAVEARMASPTKSSGQKLIPSVRKASSLSTESSRTASRLNSTDTSGEAIRQLRSFKKFRGNCSYLEKRFFQKTGATEKTIKKGIDFQLSRQFEAVPPSAQLEWIFTNKENLAGQFQRAARRLDYPIDVKFLPNNK